MIKLLSKCAFNFKLHRYTEAAERVLSTATALATLNAQGEAVQVDPFKPKLKPPGTQHLKLNYDGLLSYFGFKCNLRRYIKFRLTLLHKIHPRHFPIPPDNP